jgi:glycosyltransferase involved in cell wall biosynthesis
MKHIVIDGRELRTSSGRYVERLLHYLQTIDQAHSYSVLLKPEDLGGWQASNPNFKAVACPYKEFTFGEQLGLRRQVRGLKADLVHFPFAQQPIWYRGSVVTTIQDLTTLRFDNPSKNRLVFRFKQRIYEYVIKRVAHKSKQLITPSQFVKDDLVKFSGVSPKKITVTYEAADLIKDAPEPLADLKGKQFIMYIGRPTPHKNLERLIEAFEQLKAQHPDLLLVLAGKQDANYQRIKDDVQKANNRGVVFTGFVSEGQLRWLYENCAAYVFPSLSEGFGLPGLEAMIHGAPVASSNATCLPEIYGDAAHYFDPLDAQAMGKAIDEVLTDKNLLSKLVQNGQKQVQKYSWRKMAEQTLEVYQRSLNE